MGQATGANRPHRGTRLQERTDSRSFRHTGQPGRWPEWRRWIFDPHGPNLALDPNPVDRRTHPDPWPGAGASRKGGPDPLLLRRHRRLEGASEDGRLSSQRRRGQHRAQARAESTGFPWSRGEAAQGSAAEAFPFPARLSCASQRWTGGASSTPGTSHCAPRRGSRPRQSTTTPRASSPPIRVR
jgi:hypothetical protein